MTLRYGDCWCIARGTPLGSVDVVSGGPAGLSGAGLSPCLVGLFTFPVQASQSGKKVFGKTQLDQRLFASLLPHVYSDRVKKE